MKKYLGLGLVLVAVLAFSTSRVLARGGGHGGGHHGGGHHGSHHHSSHHHSSHHHSSHHSHHGSHYHHSNWRHTTIARSRTAGTDAGAAPGRGWGGWGWGNPWGIATFGATAAWLGLEGATPIVGNYGTVPAEDTTPTVYTADAGNAEAEGADDSDTQTAKRDNAPQQDPAQAAQAEQLAKSGATDPPKDTKFLPLGVFSLAPQGQDEASALVQLAVSNTGIVRGTYYDLLADQDHPVRGAIDKKSQQVAFTFGEQGKVVFETSLANLTQKEGAAAAHFENGQKRTWILARYEKEPTDEAGPAQPAEATPKTPAAVQ